jgi:hypothetical protein
MEEAPFMPKTKAMCAKVRNMLDAFMELEDVMKRIDADPIPEDIGDEVRELAKDLDETTMTPHQIALENKRMIHQLLGTHSEKLKEATETLEKTKTDEPEVVQELETKVKSHKRRVRDYERCAEVADAVLKVMDVDLLRSSMSSKKVKESS